LYNSQDIAAIAKHKCCSVTQQPVISAGKRTVHSQTQKPELGRTVKSKLCSKCRPPGTANPHLHI